MDVQVGAEVPTSAQMRKHETPVFVLLTGYRQRLSDLSKPVADGDAARGIIVMRLNCVSREM